MILSGYQLMVKTFAAQRPALNNVWNEVFSDNGPEAKSLIEISGSSGTGKSILLYELMARASLSTLYGGKYCKIIFIDLSHKFDFNVFGEFIQSIIKSSQLALENTLTKYHESIIYLPCYSSDQLEFAFEDFEELLWNNKRISLIAIDGLDTFYWDECYNKLQPMTTHYKKMVQRLKPICQEHNICCAYTVDSNYLAVKSKPWAHFPHSLINYKLKLIKLDDGQLYLNNSAIKINNVGIEFLYK